MSRLPAALAVPLQALGAPVRALLMAGLTVVALTVLILFNLLPAWRTVSQADAQHQQLDADLNTMLTLTAQVKQLAGQRPPARANLSSWLAASVPQQFKGTAQASLNGERLTLSLNRAPAEAVATWLAEARGQVQLLPAEARLSRASDSPSTMLWSGELVFQIPTTP